MRCKNCGWPNDEDASRCIKCQAPMAAATPEADYRSLASYRTTNPAPSAPAFGQTVDFDTMMRLCPSCGYAVSRHMTHCPLCGQAADIQTTPTHPVEPQWSVQLQPWTFEPSGPKAIAIPAEGLALDRSLDPTNPTLPDPASPAPRISINPDGTATLAPDGTEVYIAVKHPVTLTHGDTIVVGNRHFKTTHKP